jgi:uncharacterized membrane protein YfhO
MRIILLLLLLLILMMMMMMMIILMMAMTIRGIFIAMTMIILNDGNDLQKYFNCDDHADEDDGEQRFVDCDDDDECVDDGEGE